jgi:hypothetical protein
MQLQFTVCISNIKMNINPTKKLAKSTSLRVDVRFRSIQQVRYNSNRINANSDDELQLNILK